MSEVPKKNRYGETLDQCKDRLVREKVTPEVAARYAMDVAHSFEEIRDHHNAKFYREVASNIYGKTAETGA